MKKVSIALIGIVLMAFSAAPEKSTNSNSALEIQKDIIEFQQIIIQKQQSAELLELDAQKTKNTKKLEQANLLRIQCLKYEAAIACLSRHLN